MHPIILPFDGKPDFYSFSQAFLEILTQPLACELTGYIKLNDSNFYPDASAINTQRHLRILISRFTPHAGIFLDLKIADTNGTDVNILKHFQDNGVAPDILTVRDNIGAKGYLLLRRLLPNTKLALVSVLTDIPEDEVRRRNGMFPTIKIINDIVNIEDEYSAIRQESDPIRAFDMIVCSPHELRGLTTWFPYQYQYICPAIRDEWMTAGQQSRIMGVKEALDLGATYVVMGSQMTKGNPKKNIDAEESRRLTFERIKLARYSYFSPTDPIQMLYHCDGYYESPRDKDKNILGPLVAYAGKDDKGKNKVGLNYFNFAKAEENHLILSAYAAMLAEMIKQKLETPDVVLAMPMGGVALAVQLAKFLGCRYALAEKKVTALADQESGKKEESELVIKRHDVKQDDKVLYVEDVNNNFSTIDKGEAALNELGAKSIGIASAINRSEKQNWEHLPVISVCNIASPQYTQDDPEVSQLIKAGNIVWKAKHEWGKLKEAMEIHNINKQGV